MLITKRELKKIIQESASLIRESHGEPCPIATANQLHSVGYTEQEVNNFVDRLLSQFQNNGQKDMDSSMSSQNHVRSPNRGGIIGGLGFGSF